MINFISDFKSNLKKKVNLLVKLFSQIREDS